MFHALLYFSTEVSLIILGYISLKEKPKLKKISAFLESVMGNSIDVDRCASLKHEIGREKQEHKFLVVPEMNKNIILARDWLKQFGFCMYYDIGCIRIGKFLCQDGRRQTHLLIS